MFVRRDLVALAELVDQQRRVGLRRERHEEVVGARQDVLDAGAAQLNQQDGRDAVARGKPAEHQRFLDVLGVALPGGDARRLLRGVVEHPAHLLRGEAGGARGRRGRAEVAGDAVRAVVRLHLEGQSAERERHARTDVVAERDGAKQPRAVDAELLARGERRRHHRAAGMRMRRRVRIVGLVGVREHAVGHRGFDRTAQQVGRRDGRDLLAGARARKRERDAARRQRRRPRPWPRTCRGCGAWCARRRRPADRGSPRRPCSRPACR